MSSPFELGSKGKGGTTMPKYMMIIKGDQPPGELPSEEMLVAMGKYNEELAKAGVLVDLSGLHPTAEGARVKFSAGTRTVVEDRKSTRLNSSHSQISYAVFCL